MGARHLRKVSTRFAGVNCIVNLYSPNTTLLCLFRHPRINRIYHAPEVRYEHQNSPVSKAQTLYGEPENPHTPEKTSAGNADERVGPIGMGHRNNQNRADARGTQPILEDMSLSPRRGLMRQLFAPEWFVRILFHFLRPGELVHRADFLTVPDKLEMRRLDNTADMPGSK